MRRGAIFVGIAPTNVRDGRGWRCGTRRFLPWREAEPEAALSCRVLWGGGTLILSRLCYDFVKNPETSAWLWFGTERSKSEGKALPYGIAARFHRKPGSSRPSPAKSRCRKRIACSAPGRRRDARRRIRFP